VQHEIVPGMAANLGYYRTSWNNFTATDAVLVAPTDYDPYCLTLPRDGRLPDGGGNKICDLYNVKPEKFSATSGNNLITKASNYGKQTDVYDGVDLTIAARFKGTFVQGGMNVGHQVTDNCDLLFDSPQKLACHIEPPFWRPEVKLSGSHQIWYGVQLSAVYQSIPGIPVVANYVATNAEVQPTLGRPLSGSASTVTINNVVPPQTMFEKRLNQIDFRLIRNFQVGHTRIQGMFDIYNALNTAAILSEITTYGATWQKPSAILDARIFKVGMQMNF
jgi:hypothetical protein